MIAESVVAQKLLMFVNAEIKEARLQPEGMAQCLRGKRHAERQYSESVTYKCWKGSAELEDNIDGSLSIKKLIIE
jgi:hypothetical protein